MTRALFVLVTILAAAALIAVPAMAQPPAGPDGGAPGAKPPLTKEQVDNLKRMHELHSKLRTMQLDLLGLQVEGADQKKIDAKREQIEKQQEQIREFVTEHRPALGPGLGMGRGPRGWGGGPGFGMGRGPGGWGGGPGAGHGQRWQQGRGGGRGFGPGIGRGRGGPGQGFGPGGGWWGDCPYW